MNFLYGIYNQGNEILVAVCDEDVVGRVFRCSDKNIKIDVKNSFYGKNKCDEKEVLELMKNATILNIVGKYIVTLAIKEGIISKECVIEIGETLNAQKAKL